MTHITLVTLKLISLPKKLLLTVLMFLTNDEKEPRVFMADAHVNVCKAVCTAESAFFTEIIKCVRGVNGVVKAEL